MDLKTSVIITGTRQHVWDVTTDIENSINVIGGIKKIEILEKPDDTLVGLKWRETRTMFGKEATEVMWVTEEEPLNYYKVRAESHGAIYLTDVVLEGESGNITLSMIFHAEAVTLGAKIMWALTGAMFRKATEKGLLEDLKDIKNAVERGIEV